MGRRLRQFEAGAQKLRSDGGNDYKTLHLHAGKRKRQKNGGTCVDQQTVPIPMEDYRI